MARIVRMKNVAIQGIRVLGVSLTLLLSCGGKRPAEQPAATAEAPAPPVPEGHPQCVDAEDKPVRCTEDKECCAGFVCGRDPELNPQQKYCIYGG